MKIDSGSDGKITVALSNEDMNELDITYDELDYSNIETRRVIWTLLDKAGQTLGKSISTDSRLLIEVLPSKDGGCILHFTFLPSGDLRAKKRLIMKKEAEPLLFTAFDGYDFLDCTEIIASMKKWLISVECYKYKGKFRFILYPELTFSDSIAFVLSEFGECCTATSTEASLICEYGLPQRIDCLLSIGSAEDEATGNKNVSTCINAEPCSFGNDSSVNLN